MRTAATFAIALLVSCAPAAGQSEEPAASEPIDVGRALDRKLADLSISGREIPDALAELGERVGIRITIEDEAASLLPWGRQTKLAAVKIANASLREALPQILGPLGMTYEAREDGAVVVATAPLRRINRRATWEELKLLARCNALTYTPENLAKFKIEYRITRKVNAPKMLADQLQRAGRGSLANMLEVATGANGWVWLPFEDRIVIKTRQAQIANQLARRVTVRYENVPLSRILVDLARRAEVVLNLEPGMMLKLPSATAQSYTLSLQHSSIRQALEVISAETGLAYEMRRDGLYVGLSEAAHGRSQAAGPRSPYVGKLTIPSRDGSYSYDILLREDELPEDVLEYRQQIIDEYVEKMRRDMAPEGEVLRD